MRFTGIRLPLVAAFASMTVGLFVWATDRSYGDTVYVLPNPCLRQCRSLAHTSYQRRMSADRVI